MANEITALTGRDGAGLGVFTLFFQRDIATPAEVAGANVVPTPATGPASEDLLPTHVRVIINDNVARAGEIAAYDAGTKEWGTVDFVQDGALSNPELIAAAQAKYAAWAAERALQYDLRYRFVGAEVDAS